MKTKLMLNTVLSVLVALGVAACSSSPSEIAQKQIDNAKQAGKDQIKKWSNKLDEAASKKFQQEKVKLLNNSEIQIDGKKIKASEFIEVNGEGKYKLVEFANYELNKWKYQTFGQFSGVNENNEPTAGFINVGNKTKPENIPTANTVVYKGLTTAKSFIPHNNMAGDVKADVQVDINFADKSVVFKTQNSQLNGSPLPDLDLSGSAKLDVANNQFVDGKVHFTQRPRYQGTLEGAVFGPKAEEVSGTFDVTQGAFIGGFGAKQN